MGGDSPSVRPRVNKPLYTQPSVWKSLRLYLQQTVPEFHSFPRGVPLSRRFMSSPKMRRMLILLVGATLLSTICIATLSRLTDDQQTNNEDPPQQQVVHKNLNKIESESKKKKDAEAPWAAKVMEEVRVKNRRKRIPAENHDMMRPRGGQSLSEITGHVRSSGGEAGSNGKFVVLPGQEISSNEVSLFHSLLLKISLSLPGNNIVITHCVQCRY